MARAFMVGLSVLLLVPSMAMRATLPRVAHAWNAVGTTTVVQSGLRIELTVPLLDPLPRSSLFRAQVRVTNISHHTVMLPRPCDRSNPRVVAIDGKGTVEYTTVRTWPVPQRCVKNAPRPLAPGQSVERRTYLILRTNMVQPVVNVIEGGRTQRVTGKALTLAVQAHYLTPRETAVFADGSTRRFPGGRHPIPLYKKLRIAAIEVTARRPVVGPLIVIGSALCPGRQVLIPRWTAISHAHPVATIPAPCPRPRLWLVDYGWVGQSVGQIVVGRGNLRPSAG